MARLGEMLRAARHDRGVSLAEVEAATKIRHRFLVALEDEDFSSLPETVYVIGILRTYADYLGLDPEQAVLMFREQSGRRDPPGLQPETRLLREARRNKPRFSPGAVSVVLIVAGLALLLFYGYQQYLRMNEVAPPASAQSAQPSPTVDLVGQLPTPTAPVVGVVPTETPVPTPTVPTGVTIELRVVSADCWVRAIVDDTLEFQGTLKPGDTRTWQGDKSVLLRVGNAGAAEITYNGIHEGTMGPMWAVREKEWTVRANR